MNKTVKKEQGYRSSVDPPLAGNFASKSMICPISGECGYSACPHHGEHVHNETCGEGPNLTKSGYCPACRGWGELVAS